MPTYEFKKEADGSIVPIDAPDRATAIQMFKSGAVAPRAQEGVIGRSNPLEFKTVDTQPAGVLSRAGSGVADPYYGVQQLYAHSVGDSEMQLSVDKFVNERERELRATGAGEGDWARSAGRMVPAAAIGTALGGPAGGVTGAIAGGGVSELLNPVVTDVNPRGESNYTEVKGRQTLMGMGTGGAGGALVKGIGKTLAPKLSADAQKMVDAGVELTPARIIPGDISGKIARRVEDVSHSIPGTGVVIGEASKRSISSYNLAQINQALDPIGVKLPDTVKAGHEAIAFMTKAGNKSYDDILKSNPQLKVPPTIWPKLESDINNAAFLARSLPPNSVGLQFQQILQDRVLRVLDPLAQGQSLPASLMKKVDADLRHFISAYHGAADPAYRMMADHLKDVRVAVRDALAVAHPKQAAALKQADIAWSQITKIQEAANKATAEGMFMPAHMLGAIRHQDPSIRHHNFAAGVSNKNMLDFAEAAHRLLPSKVADSGTGERLAHVGGASALGYLNPYILAGLAGGALPYTGPGMTLANMIANPGPKQKAVAKAFQTASPYVGTTAEPLVKNAVSRTHDQDIPTLDFRATSSRKGEPGQMERFAEGGRPEVGKPALVGEEESEPFILAQSQAESLFKNPDRYAQDTHNFTAQNPSVYIDAIDATNPYISHWRGTPAMSEVKNGLKRLSEAYAAGHPEIRKIVDRHRSLVDDSAETYARLYGYGPTSDKIPADTLWDMMNWGMHRSEGEQLYNSNLPEAERAKIKKTYGFDLKGRNRFPFQEALDILERGSTVGAPPSSRQWQVPHYAKGGRPNPGAPALVGEGEEPRPELWISDSGKKRVVGANGPEVIVPDEPGTIIPHEQAKKLTYRDYLMDAIRSLTQRMDPTRLVQPPGPQTGSIPQDLAGSLPLASLALRPSAVRLTPTNSVNPRLQVRGQFASHTNDPRWAHPGVMNAPLVAGAAATNLLPEDSAPTVERPAPAAPVLADLMAETEGQVPMRSPVAERWGEMAPPLPEQQPLPAQSGAVEAPRSEMNVPLPRAKPAEQRKAPAKQKTRQPALDPTLLEQIAALLRTSPDLARLAQPVRRGGAANGHYAEGGRPPMGQPAVVGDAPGGMGNLAAMFGGAPGMAKAFAGGNPFEGVDMSNKAGVLSSLFGGMPGLAGAFGGTAPQGGSPSLESLTGMFGGTPGMAQAFAGEGGASGRFGSSENSALQDDGESDARRRRFGGSMPGYAEGGRPEPGAPAVVGETEMFTPGAPTVGYPIDAPTEAFSRPPLPEDPFERAALRQRGGRPTPEPAEIATPAEMIETASLLAPAPLRALAASPKLATAALAAYYGLAGTDEAGGAESPDAVKKLQTVLKEKGFYGGTIDGQMGEATKKAKAAFDKAEEVRMNNERDQARILTEQKQAEAATATASAQGELAKAQLEETKRRGEEEKRKGEEREAGSKRLREVESNLSTTQKITRDYAQPIGFTGGALAGKALQATVAKAYNKIMGNKAATAEKLFAEAGADELSRVAKVNEFWRQGGGKVPFTNTPATAPGFAANPQVTSMDKLYKPPTKTNTAVDAAAVGLLEGEGALAGHFMVKPREEELRLANEAVAADASEVNINRLQDAKDKLAVAEMLQTGGRVGGLGYLGGAAIKGRVHSMPNKDKAEAEKLFLEGVLRKSADAKEKSAKLKATKEKKAAAKAEIPEGKTLNIVPAGIPPAFTGSAAAQARRVNLR